VDSGSRVIFDAVAPEAGEGGGGRWFKPRSKW
jgi:hypothetical protein